MRHVSHAPTSYVAIRMVGGHQLELKGALIGKLGGDLNKHRHRYFACIFTFSHETIYHVMPREIRCGALDSCFGPHQLSIPQLLSLAQRVYKG